VRLWPSTGLWRHADFLRLWSGQTISQFGSQISQLAIPLAAIIVLDASAFEVALLSAVEFLPFLLFTLPAGVWVDRLTRRPILIWSDAGRALALASVPIAYAFGALTIWQLFAVGFVIGTLTVSFDVAYQSYLPSLVQRDALIAGNSLLEGSRSAAQVAGPGVGGVLVGALTAPYAILVDAVSFACSALLVLRIRTLEEAPERVADRSMLRELREGLGYLLRHHYWRAMATTTGATNFFWSLVGSVILVFAVRTLGMSPAVIGLVITLGSIGGLVGALFASRIGRRLGVGPTIVGASVLFGPPLLLVPLASRSWAIPCFVFAFLLSTAGATIYAITGLSLMQTLTPERLLGRMNASRRFIVFGTIPLGSLTGGVLASQLGLRPTIWIGAIGACFCFLPIALSPIRRIGAMPTQPEPDFGYAGLSVPAAAHLDA
jgi:MFS family permease